MTIRRASQDETVELICFAHYGRQDGRIVERVLADPQNRGLAGLGTFLPLGTVIHLPDLTPLRPAAETRLIVNPWD